MIKRLQRRFIVITMGLISLVLIVTFASMIYSSSTRMAEDSLRILNEDMLRQRLFDGGTDQPDIHNGSEPLLPDGKPRPFDRVSPFATFHVIVSESSDVGNLVDNSGQITMEIAEEALEAALSQNRESGTISDLSLRYLKVVSPQGATAVGFIDISYEQEFIGNLILRYLAIGGASLLTMLLISIYLSRYATKPIEKAWRQQQQFVADASHELKTPITVILANTSILTAEPNTLPEEDHKWISYIDLEAKRMKKLVEDLLFLARVDSSEHRAVQSRLSLSDLVFENILPFEALIYESGKTLDTDIAPGIHCRGNSGQLKQLVSVLLDNAVKYAADASAVTVHLAREEGQAVISVNNLGVPIPKDDIAHIFDRFYRVDKARGRESSSYGLGLAIAHEIVTAHKGSISVTSDRETGTTFRVVLPIA